MEALAEQVEAPVDLKEVSANQWETLVDQTGGTG
jgi:hypothetical protein